MKLVFLFVILSFSGQVNANIWRWNHLCNWPGCTEARAATLGEFCTQQVSNINSYLQSINSDQYVVLVKPVIVGLNSSAEPGGLAGQGVCVVNGNWYISARLDAEKCPNGKSYESRTARCIEKQRPTCFAGNPIEVESGLKAQTEIDYIFKGKSGASVKFSRVYRSQARVGNKDYDNNSYTQTS